MGQGILQIQISLAEEIKKTYYAYQIVLVYKYVKVAHHKIASD